MSETRFGRMQKAVALVPLALLSTAWTASLTGVGFGGAVVASAADEATPTTLPDGTTVPSQAIEDPASFSQPGSLGLAIPSGDGDKIVQAASTNGIPAAALSAYQRAATVINSADKACNIPWQLIAAIGRVESDHGRFGNNTLGKDGVSRPGIYGIALDGSNNTQEISDTDAGQFDNDQVYDRAVGPMQFIPSTWSVVGVDADGDAKRNPQDIDDASLASAVYLCSGSDDLSTEAGQRTAVFRYNHSQKYVDLVLAVMNAYMQGDFSAVPNSTTSAIYFQPKYNFTKPTVGAKVGGHKTKVTNTGNNTGGGDDTPTSQEPTTGDKGSTTPPSLPTGNDGGDDPAKKAKEAAKKLEETVKETVKAPVEAVLSLTEAINLCNSQIPRLPDVLNLGIQDKAVDRCAQRVTGSTEQRALAIIPNTVLGILNWLGL